MDFGFLLSGLGGIVTGLVGPIAKGVLAYKQQKLDFEHKEKMVKLTSEAAIAEVNANIRQTEAITEGNIRVAEVGALTEALKGADRQVFTVDYMKYLTRSKFGQIVAGLVAFGLACVEILRQGTRPAVTIYYVGMSTWVTWLAYQVLQTTGAAITATFAQEIFRMSVLTIFYLVIAIINFWFVNREQGLIKKIAEKV